MLEIISKRSHATDVHVLHPETMKGHWVCLTVGTRQRTGIFQSVVASVVAFLHVVAVFVSKIVTHLLLLTASKRFH